MLTIQALECCIWCYTTCTKLIIDWDVPNRRRVDEVGGKECDYVNLNTRSGLYVSTVPQSKNWGCRSVPSWWREYAWHIPNAVSQECLKSGVGVYHESSRQTPERWRECLWPEWSSEGHWMCMLLTPSFTWALTLFASVHSPSCFKQRRQSTGPIHWLIQLYIVSCNTIDLLENK